MRGPSPLTTRRTPSWSSAMAAEGHAHGVAGPELFLLQDRRRVTGKHGFDELRLVAHHDERSLRQEGPRRPDHVIHHGDTAQRVKDLRPVGLHPGALAGSQDHGEDRRTLRHVPAQLLSLVSSPAAGAAGFEPAIPGPKPGALPLGHAPVRPQKIIPERLFAVRKAGAIVEKNTYKVLLVVEPLLCNLRPALMQRLASLSDAIYLVLGTWPPEYGLGTPRVTQGTDLCEISYTNCSSGSIPTRRR